LKLSAFGAEWLHGENYQARALINWNASLGENDYLENLTIYAKNHPNRKIQSHALFDIPSRLWVHCCEKSGMDPESLFGNISKKSMNRLIQHLFCHNLAVSGKTTFKEEFVTAGGIDLSEVNPDTMQSVYYPNLCFCWGNSKFRRNHRRL
jgi:predicted flavoprotein YhiN